MPKRRKTPAMRPTLFGNASEGLCGEGGDVGGGWNGGGATSAAAPADAPPSSGVCDPGLHPACAFRPARPHALAVCTRCSAHTHGQLSVAHALRRLRPFCLSHVSPGTIFPRTVPLLSDLPPLSFSLRDSPLFSAPTAPHERRLARTMLFRPARPAENTEQPHNTCPLPQKPAHPPERRQKARRIETPGPVQPCRPHEKAGRCCIETLRSGQTCACRREAQEITACSEK